jgi:predicted NBD/HSP70 family sugar kinase
MIETNYSLIGIDGGATKVSGWIIEYFTENDLYVLSGHHSELPYSAIDGHKQNFTPVDIKSQLSQRETENLQISDDEHSQGQTYIEATADVIANLFMVGNKRPLLIGIGMPGLKTPDQRGINAIANGPRMPSYCSTLEDMLQSRGVKILAPIFRLGSDADYCGVGEYYAAEGSFQKTENAYYLGGGTGAADALILKGKLTAFDEVKSWMAKTWEMKNDYDLSFERYASASGLQYIYSRHSDISVESLNKSKIYPPQIAELACKGDLKAKNAFKEIAKYLSILIFDRIVTLHSGSSGIIDFVNPNRDPLKKNHPYLNEKFDKIIIGQRLGDLMSSDSGKEILTNPFINELSDLIANSETLSDEVKSYYLKNDTFNPEILSFSKLREAPALGAGIDAHLNYIGN